MRAVRGRRANAAPTGLLLVCLLGPISAVSGCGGESFDRLPVSGTVTHQGKPVPVGTIAFEPDISLGDVPTAVGRIEDGKYAIPPERGPVAGPYVVRIRGFDGKPTAPENRDPAEPEGANPRGAPLFPEYTTQVELNARKQTWDFDVPE